MMKKMLFLMLFLLILGAANVSSQVRIGGNGVPNGAAVLDLNATDVINTGTKGLALPRVTLGSNTAQITTGVVNLSGMLVYNTGGSLGAGIYYWNGSQWQPLMNGALAERDSVIGNEVVNATPNMGLVRSGSGTANSVYTLGLDTTGAKTGYMMYWLGDRWAPRPYLPAALALIYFNLHRQIRKDSIYRFPVPDTLNFKNHTVDRWYLNADAVGAEVICRLHGDNSRRADSIICKCVDVYSDSPGSWIYTRIQYSGESGNTLYF